MRIFIFFFLPVVLFSVDISFDELYQRSLKVSPILKDLDDNLEIKKNDLYKETYPGGIIFNSSISPIYNFNSVDDGLDDFAIGSVSLNINPYYNMSIGLSHTFDESTSLSLSYTPFQSRRSIISGKKNVELSILSAIEERTLYYENIKKLYYDLYFLKESYKIELREVELLKWEIQIKENLAELNKINFLILDEAYIKQLDSEISLINSELNILKREEELVSLSGLNIGEMDFQLESVPPLRECELNSDSLEFYKNRVDYLSLVEKIRDQKLALKESKTSIIPDLTFSGGIRTSDYENITGFFSIGGDFSFGLNYSRDIRTQSIYLEKQERALEDIIKKYQISQKYKNREIETSRRQIDILRKSLKGSTNRLKISKYKYENGDILEVEYHRTILNNKKIKLDVVKAELYFYINYCKQNKLK